MKSHFVEIVTATVGNSRLNQSLEISEFTFSYQYYSYIPQAIPIDPIWVSSSITQKDTPVSHYTLPIALNPFPPQSNPSLNIFIHKNVGRIFI